MSPARPSRPVPSCPGCRSRRSAGPDALNSVGCRVASDREALFAASAGCTRVPGREYTDISSPVLGTEFLPRFMSPAGAPRGSVGVVPTVGDRHVTHLARTGLTAGACPVVAAGAALSDRAAGTFPTATVDIGLSAVLLAVAARVRRLPLLLLLALALPGDRLGDARQVESNAQQRSERATDGERERASPRSGMGGLPVQRLAGDAA